MQRKIKQEEDKVFAMQAEVIMLIYNNLSILKHQRIMQIKMEREKQRRKDELLRNQKEFNSLKNEEQKIKLKTQYDVKIE